MNIPEYQGNARPLVVETIPFLNHRARLISCDHISSRMPSEDPWAIIEDNILRSELIFVEYFPHELEFTIFNNHFRGNEAREIAEKSGITPFFNRVAELSAKHQKDVAVADIANRPSFIIYEHYLRTFLGAAGFAVGMASGFNMPQLPGTIVAELGAVYMMIQGAIAASKGIDVGFGSIQMNRFERYSFDLLDARRLETAKGIEEEAKERPIGTDIMYIAPHAHVNRVKWYLENPNNPFVRAKKALYPLLPRLDHHPRVYRYDEEYQDWNLSSDKGETNYKL